MRTVTSEERKQVDAFVARLRALKDEALSIYQEHCRLYANDGCPLGSSVLSVYQAFGLGYTLSAIHHTTSAAYWHAEDAVHRLAEGGVLDPEAIIALLGEDSGETPVPACNGFVETSAFPVAD